MSSTAPNLSNWCRIAPEGSSIQHIPDLDSLRRHLSEGAVLVAFDTESYGHFHKDRLRPTGEASELGFAALQWPRPALRLNVPCKDFAYGNGVELLTVQLQQRTCKSLERTTSPIKHVNGLEETKQNIYQFLPESTKVKVILVGYHLSTEFRWIAMNCPALIKSFAAWVDVQELVMQQHAPRSTDTPSRQVSLKAALHAMGLAISPNTHKQHRAANDASRTLQLLSGFLMSRPFTPTPSHHPHSVRLQPLLKDRKRFPISLYILSSNRKALPRRTSEEIAQMHQTCGVAAAGAYCCKDNRKAEFTRVHY